MANVLFHPEAQAEYDSALGWYQARSPRAAARFEFEMDRLLGLIDANPALYPAYDDAHRFAVLRRYPYTVIYQAHPTPIFLVAVAHSARAAGYWQGWA